MLVTSLAFTRTSAFGFDLLTDPDLQPFVPEVTVQLCCRPTGFHSVDPPTQLNLLLTTHPLSFRTANLGTDVGELEKSQGTSKYQVI